MYLYIGSLSMDQGLHADEGQIFIELNWSSGKLEVFL
jgi:hypothetical protein